MKKNNNQISAIIAKSLEISDEKLIALHVKRVITLYSHLELNVLLEDDPETLLNDLKNGFLTFFKGQIGVKSRPDDIYSMDDEWWWYMDVTHNGAISVRTGEILGNDDIDIDFRP